MNIKKICSENKPKSQCHKLGPFKLQLMCQSAVCNVVAESVKSEMKSYRAVAAIANKKISAPEIKTLTKAMKQVVQEEDCSKNIIVLGLQESVDEDTNSVIDKVFESVGDKPRHDSVRIGSRLCSKA